MEYRALGQTGLKISALSFGASSLGGAFREVDEAESIRAVHVSIERGINFIDVSPFYGLTRAETLLGKALESIPRDQYALATKVGRYGTELSDFDFSARRVTASVDESLKRLGVGYIDLIHAHDIEFGNLDQVIGETIPALRKLQTAGKVRFIGVTGLPLSALRRVVEATPIDAILSYCHFELNDTALADLIPILKKRGVGVINASPLGMGLLSNRGTPSWHPAPEEVKETCARAAAHCRVRGASIEKLAVQFSLTNPDIATTVVGSANPKNMERNIAWADEAVDQAMLQEVLTILKPVHNVTWASGRGENN
ncbi:MAG TPA: aldo/keto reductase [Tepidisphaeraceae bacterium]|jgi:L-galactose dehydrogenase|nr:aldo/keto reductase [Tepidisphaeraceae bacterium]